MDKPKIVFMGTPEFSVPTLAKLHEVYGVEAVVTVPDKPQGRGKKLIPSAVKQKAIELRLPLLQPDKLKDSSFIGSIEELKPDIIVVIAFRILPEEVYTKARLGTFNIHASLLPRYRGAAPINWAIINGESETGLTSFLLKKEVDTGDILLQDKFPIPDGFTAGDLHDFMMPRAVSLAIDTCNLLLSENYRTIPQDSSLASPAPKLFRETSHIDWNKTDKQVRNFIHGNSPTPSAWSLINGERIKILRASISNDYIGDPGTYLITKSKFEIACSSGAISVIELQPEGKKSMKTSDFINGYRGAKSGILE